MPSPTHFTGGISTARSTAPLGAYGLPDPTAWITYFNDFTEYVAGDWTITTTQAGAGSSSVALTDVNGGAILITNDDADNDNVFMQKVGEAFLLAAGKKAFFKCRFKVSDATQSDVVIGLQVTDTTPLDVTDGIYFLKADDAATYDFICRKNATTGSVSASAVGTLVSDTFVELAWAFDSRGNVKYFVDGAHKGTLDASSTYLPDTELCVSFGIQNGAAAIKTMTVDFVFAALER